jgi:diguanylate cyclase (GGDEF)-like protein
VPTPAELLARVPLFAALEPGVLDDLGAATRIETFEAGSGIFELGEPGRSLFVICDGTVSVRHPNRDAHFELAHLGPGDFFGEMALLNNATRSASAQATSPVTALVLDRVDFHRLVRERPEIAFRVLETLSERIRHADELIQGLTERAIRDPLTGLLNKQAFSDRLAEEIARTRRYGGSFSLILLDFDDFDAVNSAVGRENGDRILLWAGRLLNEHTRSSDVSFRIEEDAFTILCPWTAGPFAEHVADRLTSLIDEAVPPIEARTELSISTGIATCPSDAQEGLALYRAAERSLTEAKA